MEGIVSVGYLSYLAGFGISAAALIKENFRLMTEEQTIRQNLQLFIKAYNDRAEIPGFVSERFLENFSAIQSQDVARIKRTHFQGPNPRRVSINLSVSVREILVDETIAFNFNTWRSTLSIDGEFIDRMKVNTMDVWRKTEGVWRLYRSHRDPD